MEIAFVITISSPEMVIGVLNEGTDGVAITRPGKKLENSAVTVEKAERLQELGMVLEGDGDEGASRLYQER